MADVAKKAGKLIIREIREEDIDDILALDKKLVGKDRAITYRGMAGNYLGGEFGLSFVARVDKRLVGFAMGLLSNPKLGWIQVVGVDPDYRRQDIAMKLLEALFDRYRAKGIENVRIAVNWRDLGMLSFLNSAGFSRGDTVELEKKL